MDRQDLKEGQEVYVKGRVIHTGNHLDIVLDKGSFIENAIILNHEKPVVPQFVADWIDVCKEKLAVGLYIALNPDFVKQYSKSNELIAWVRKYKNQEVFARAWIFGYEVEKEKRYLVKITKTKQYLYSRDNDFYFVTYVRPDDNPHNCHNRKELEDAGFGWVFDCPGIEVEEVE